MRSGIFVLGMAAVVLGGPAVAMNTVSAPQPAPVAGTPVTPAPPCDGCDSSTNTTTPTNDAGSSTGPITDPTAGHPAHTATPSHVPDLPKPGGAPKG